MNMKDFHSGTKHALLLGAAALSADSTPVSVDLQGFLAAEILLGVGVGGITFSGTNKVEFVLEHSDDDSVWANVTDAHMLGVTSISGGIIKSLVAAHAAAAVYRFGYIGGKRYIRLTADFSGTHGAATPMAASALLGRATDAPVADQA